MIFASGLSMGARFGTSLLLGTIWSQIGLGVEVIRNGAPVDLAWSHALMAWWFLTVLLYTMHSCRRVDPRHIKNLFGKLKMDNPEVCKKLLAQHDSKIMSRKTYNSVISHLS